MEHTALVEFHGSQLPSKLIDGKPHVALKPIVESIGLDWAGQFTKLKEYGWATIGQTDMVAADGRNRQMTTVDMRTLLMFLATIHQGKVAEHVRPMLISYQNEVADVIEAYWGQGGAVNPRATSEQLDDLVDTIEVQRQRSAVKWNTEMAEMRMKVYRLAEGMVDEKWLGSQVREQLSIMAGSNPETPFAERTLTVSEYLSERGVAAEGMRRWSSSFGKRLKALHVAKRGCEPGVSLRFVDGAQREVAAYREEHRDLFDEVYCTMFPGL